MCRPAIVLLVLLLACGATEPQRQPNAAGNVGPSFPGSEVLREVTYGEGELYDPSDRANSCGTTFTDYGSNDSPEDVTAFFVSQGFARLGEGGRFARGYRWAGERAGDEKTWRKVDIADGATAGRPEWQTAYEVFAPACDVQPGDGDRKPSPAASRPDG